MTEAKKIDFVMPRMDVVPSTDDVQGMKRYFSCLALSAKVWEKSMDSFNIPEELMPHLVEYMEANEHEFDGIVITGESTEVRYF